MFDVRHLTTWVAPLALLASLILVTASYGEPVVFEVSDDLIEKSVENVDAVSLILQPADDPRPAPPRAARRRGRYNSLLGTNRTVRMQRAPAMFGDFFAALAALDVVLVNGEIFDTTTPFGGGATRSKVSDNNRALTDNRCYFLFNHFHNALQQNGIIAPDLVSKDSVNRYTIGFERSFHDLLWSVELRIPLASGINVDVPNQFNVSAGAFGNIAVIFKRMLWETDNRAISAGLGFDLPTGSDVEGLAGRQPFVIHNEAVHLQPFVGFTCARSDVVFFHGFFQLDLATNSNTVNLARQTAKFTEQNLMLVDVSMGAWLYKNPDARHLTGVAALFELHYATTLQPTDFVNLRAPSGEDLILVNAAGQIGVLNLTTGIHAELGNWAIRVGGVFPLKTGADQKFFDSELWLSIVKSI
ncbi:MAG: hypothetical protein IH991_25365 [Planctomycetes bacterium]|nr:hypothetical protein [Planctomycetota bacterium]